MIEVRFTKGELTKAYQFEDWKDMKRIIERTKDLFNEK